jgi:hypothetical protein
LSDGIGQKSVISESEFHTSASGVFGHTMPSLSSIRMTEDAHLPFGREIHRHAFGF